LAGGLINYSSSNGVITPQTKALEPIYLLIISLSDLNKLVLCRFEERAAVDLSGRADFMISLFSPGLAAS